MSSGVGAGADSVEAGAGWWWEVLAGEGAWRGQASPRARASARRGSLEIMGAELGVVGMAPG